MDTENLKSIQLLNPDKTQKIKLMLDFLYPGEDMSVPDPYFGGQNGFDEVYALLDRACDALIDKLNHKS
jgi:protein-tyrosine phosphatase